uniref:Metalloendopeptidase n=1 Tax=Timema californicum TaxID=61474 RepID=A0A7R9J1P3_TIMCA|nr:unnamed protein product [Timema californicum]
MGTKSHDSFGVYTYLSNSTRLERVEETSPVLCPHDPTRHVLTLSLPARDYLPREYRDVSYQIESPGNTQSNLFQLYPELEQAFRVKPLEPYEKNQLQQEADKDYILSESPESDISGANEDDFYDIPLGVPDEVSMREVSLLQHSSTTSNIRASSLSLEQLSKTMYIYLREQGSGRLHSSAVGRQGGSQQVSLGPGCLYKGIIVHELMHAVGFWHEQSRGDRDHFVTVLWDNIQRGETTHRERGETTHREVGQHTERWDNTQRGGDNTQRGGTTHREVGQHTQRWDNTQRGMEFNFYKFSSRVMQDLDTAYDTISSSLFFGYARAVRFARSSSPLAVCGWLRTASTRLVRRVVWLVDSLWFQTHVHARRLFTSLWLSGGQTFYRWRNFSRPREGLFICGEFSGSVMHYGMYSFSKDRRSPTIIPKRENTVLLGQRRGFSQTDIVKVNRLYECGSGVAPTSPTVPVGAKPVVCSDNHRYCRHWYNTGECKTNPTWMAINCARSCTQCAVKCEDHNQHCERWATIGECAKNPDYMNIYCARACGACSDGGSTSCEDRSQHCKYWAKSGQCQENPRYMLQHCRRACRMC